MPNFKQQYKNPRLGFGDTEESRNLRAYRHDQTRRCTRTVAFNKNRKLDDVSPIPNISPDKRSRTQANNTYNITDERKTKLMKWKEERERKKKLEGRNKRPPFRVGIVHHSVCSPIVKSNVAALAAKPKQASQAKPIKKPLTKATEKRLQRKKQFDNSVVSTSSKHVTGTKNAAPHPQHKTSFAPDNHMFKPPSGVQRMPLFGLVPFEETPQEKGDFFVQTKLRDSTKLDAKKQDDKNTTQNKLKRSSASTSAIEQKMPLFGLVPYEETPQEKGDFFAQTKSKDSTKPDVQKQDDAAANKSKRSSTTKIAEISTSSPSKRSSLRKLRVKETPPSSVPCEIAATSNENSTPSSLAEKTSDDRAQSEETAMPSKSDTKTPPQIENDAESTLIAYSPYVTQSRGKRNARKEQEQRLGIRKSSIGKIPTKDTVMRDLNISAEEEERTAHYFKLLLNREVDRLQELCIKWLEVQANGDTPEDAVYEIQQAVGQTRLLLNKKLERFRGLVRDCEAGKGEMLVTCRDLQGFWDMACMEVRDCDARFEKLERRKDRDWQQEEEEEEKKHNVVAKTVAVRNKRKPAKKHAGASSKPSALRSMILAARKKKTEAAPRTNEEDPSLQHVDLNAQRVTPSRSSRKSVIFQNDVDSHSRRSRRSALDSKENRRSTIGQRASSRLSSLQKTRLSKSPFAIMKISQKLKTPEIQLDDTITYINSDQTPAKSILKKSEDSSKEHACAKSAQKVNFDDQVTEVVTTRPEKTQTDLDAAYGSIDAFYTDKMFPHEPIKAERKLNFESDTDDSLLDPEKLPVAETAECDTQKSPVQTYCVNQQAPDSNACPLSDLTTRLSLDGEAAMTNDAKSIPEVRILRNRTITTCDTPKNRRSKIMTSDNKAEGENSIKLIRKTRSSSKTGNYKTPNKENITKDGDETATENIDERRKSARKSVAFNVCLICDQNKPAFPVTPHSKRQSKTPSRQSKHDEDLISWDTPERPARVTRSFSRKN